ncbi:Zn-dependent protease [Neosynechococcus sphagnicola sy1]|uniref:Zinc metalloprotease n=1 Tax=Neosynechococcus sphagnicola sy1 TaxID=1497020 RepID=A0A098TK74_9CYAN|nr:site-2 protease family protein [Neosynechococcus sphagnicola]KGF72676.1 Zn-dependent protease [Neosynechococcus sphagnicola sy1]
MQARWRIGSLFGIPLYIDPSWLFIVALVTVGYSLDWQSVHPEWGSVRIWSAGLVMALLLFGSVLLHELGHSLVALSQGIKVNSITLFLFGGVAAIEQESKTPGKAFQLAIAGPAVSLGLFGLTLLLATVTTGLAQVLAANLAQVNLLLALFNLIPALPLDGGQVLKALIWKITGNRFQGVHWAARTGQTLGSVAIAGGLGLGILRGQFIGFWVALLGWFVLRNATAYDRLTDLQEGLQQLTAADASSRDFRVVDAEITLRQFADTYLLEENRPTVYFAASEGRYRGQVAAEDLRRVERSQWETQSLHAIVHALSDIPTVLETTPLLEVIETLEAKTLPWITILSPAGAVSGVIDRGDIVRAVAKRMNIQIPDAEITRIKKEGTYPPGLQLPALAKLSEITTSTVSKDTQP